MSANGEWQTSVGSGSDSNGIMFNQDGGDLLRVVCYAGELPSRAQDRSWLDDVFQFLYLCASVTPGRKMAAAGTGSAGASPYRLRAFTEPLIQSLTIETCLVYARI